MYSQCYVGLNVYVPENLYFEALFPNMMMFESEDFGQS